jgi:hypothetical protein
LNKDLCRRIREEREISKGTMLRVDNPMVSSPRSQGKWIEGNTYLQNSNPKKIKTIYEETK